MQTTLCPIIARWNVFIKYLIHQYYAIQADLGCPDESKYQILRNISSPTVQFKLKINFKRCVMFNAPYYSYAFIMQFLFASKMWNFVLNFDKNFM